MFQILSLVTVMLATLVSAVAQNQAAAQGSFQVTANSLTMRGNPIRQTADDAGVIRETAYRYPADEFKPGVVKVGPRPTYLKEGLSTEEVVRLLGKPAAMTERRDEDATVTILEFPRSEGQVLIARFVKNKLVGTTIEARTQVAQVNPETPD